MFPTYFEELRNYFLGKLKNHVEEPYCHYLALCLTMLIDLLLVLTDFTKTLLLFFSAAAVLLLANDYNLHFIAGILTFFSFVEIFYICIKKYSERQEWRKRKATIWDSMLKGREE